MIQDFVSIVNKKRKNNMGKNIGRRSSFERNPIEMRPRS